MGSSRPRKRGVRRAVAVTMAAVGGPVLATWTVPGHAAVPACAAGLAVAVAVIAVLTAVVAALALGSAFAGAQQQRQAARRTLVVLLRLAPWYSSRR